MSNSEHNNQPPVGPRFRFSLRRLLVSMLLVIFSVQCWLGLVWCINNDRSLLVLFCWIGGSARGDGCRCAVPKYGRRNASRAAPGNRVASCGPMVQLIEK